MRLKAAGHATKRSVFSISSLGLAAALLALAGCGSSSSSSTTSASTAAAAPTTSSAATSTTTPATTGGSSKVSVEANPEGKLEYNTKALTAKAGKVTVDFTNSSSLPHNVTIESSSGEKVGATPTFAGGSKSLPVTLKPGTYKFFCSVPGHRQAGMEGTLTVN